MGRLRTVLSRLWRGRIAASPAVFAAPVLPVDALFAQLAAADELAAPVGRAEALQVAAVQRARNELSAIATLPLRLYQGVDVIESSLLRQIDPDVANVVTLAQTIEDMLFAGVSWWRVTLTDFAGYPLAARHLDVTSVSLDPPTSQHAVAPLPGGYDPRGAVVWIDGQPVPASAVVRFDSPHPPLLSANARSIRRALLLDRLASTYADNPRPLDYFTDADDPSVDPMSDDDVGPFLSRWRWWRKQSGTAYIPGNVKRLDVSQPSPAELQLVELQRQASLEIANGCGVDPEDLGVSTTSRTYFNAVDRRQEKINRNYAPFMRAITDRLSMGDVTRRGYTVGFDLSDYLKADPLGQATYWEALMRMGVTDAAEVRTWAKLPGPPPTAPAAPVPAAAVGGPSTSSAITSLRHPGDVSRAPRQLTATAAAFAQPVASARTVAFPGHTFTVDAAARTISGLAVPYGVESAPNPFGLRTVFDPGSLEWSAVPRVKHLRDHQLPVGKATVLEETPDGLRATLDVQPGADGDALLAAAAHGTYDGLSVGVDFVLDSADVTVDTDTMTARVHRATLLEISTCALPAFDDARVDRVTASRGDAMPCPHCGQLHRAGIACSTVATPTVTATALLPDQQPDPPPDPAPDPPEPEPARAYVDPRRPLPQVAEVREASPYHLIRSRVPGADVLRRGTHDFSQDLHAWFTDRDEAAGRRALGFVRAQFDTDTGDVTALNPARQRPDMWVDQRDYTSPVWDAINKGALADITPFTFPKFVSASGLVGAHTEGQEPTPGDYAATSQTVSPSAISGKAKITREVWDQGGNPQVSTLIWNQMVRGWREGLEAAAVKVLDDATPGKITLTPGTGSNQAVTVAELERALAALQFVRGGFVMTDAYTQVDLYGVLTSATDTTGRPLLPIIGASNANGQTANKFGAVTIAGVDWLPAWALAASGTAPASSYVFDRTCVHGWASAPARLTMDMTEVANVYLGIWGYKATAISDVTGVREVVYDPSATLPLEA